MRRGLFALAALLLCSGQAPAPAAVMAEAGGVNLTAADVSRLLAALAPEMRARLTASPPLLDRLVQGEIVQLLLLQQAHAHAWGSKPEIAFRAQRAHDAVVADSYLASLAAPPDDYPTDAEVQAAYEAEKPRLLTPRQYHLAQIFVAVPPHATAAAKAKAEKQMAAVRKALARSHADFAAIARRDSDEKTSAAAGGDIGWISEDRLRPAIRDAVSGMQQGAVSEPLRADDGWHIVKLLGTKPAAPKPLAKVRSQLVQALRQARVAQTERKLIGDMLHRQPVRLDEIGLQHLVKP